MSRNEQALWLSLAERPFDAALRQVLADELLERGDARGEVINLCARGNLSLTEKRRVQRLVKKHEAEWLGALAPHVDLVRTKWDGGFLSELWFLGNVPPAKWNDIAADPCLATVVMLGFSLGPTLPQLGPLVASPMVRHVRKLRGGLGVLSLVATSEVAFSLEAASFVTWSTGADDIEPLAEVLRHAPFAAVTTLELAPQDLLNEYTTSELRRTLVQQQKMIEPLTELRLLAGSSAREAATGWLSLNAERTWLEESWHGRWCVTHYNVDYALERDARGRLTSLVIRAGDDAHDLGARLASINTVLVELRTAGLVSLEVRLPTGAKLRAEERAELRRAARRVGTIERVTIGGVSTAP